MSLSQALNQFAQNLGRYRAGRVARQQDAQNLQDRQWLLVQVLQVEQPDSEQFLGGGVIGNQVHCERGLRYPVDGTAVEGGAVEQ